MRTAQIGQNRELSSETVGTKGRMGHENPKEPRANQILPHVFNAKRDKEARIGQFGGICPRQFGTAELWGRKGHENLVGPRMNLNRTHVLRAGEFTA
ncbi:hypothetical protein KI387_005944 [Taxus chinensis]|uniref:Uncharacterized protein n=1 Tax=Taxus chinensis TaxID=29808 RepID=A0AA38GNB1_TAXCH|nr:hypothetical protein KI387_005944 [Taxus chinensis]